MRKCAKTSTVWYSIVLCSRKMSCDLWLNFCRLFSEGFTEISNLGQSSVLHVYYDSNENTRPVIPKFFVWQIDGVGILFGKVSIRLRVSDENSETRRRIRLREYLFFHLSVLFYSRI